MELLQNVSLKPFNTFGIQATAQYYQAFTSVAALSELLEGYGKMESGSHQLTVLGGGSNILLTKNVNGLVLKNELRGIVLVKEDEEHYFVKAQAGENWHQFVLFCVNNNYAGVENLSLIPGNVGASPMQNIGAYGVEIKDVFYELEAYDLLDKKVVKYGVNDCAFGYRESVFKHQYKGRFIILNVTYKLFKNPVFNIAYGAIKEELEKMQVSSLSVKAISDAVIHIRQSKLPDPAVIGNAGSFFKNPVIGNEQFALLKKNHNNIVAFAAGENQTKLAAGWLIEQCGFKGYRKGDAGCYNKQALVLVNYGSATGGDIYNLSTEIIEAVKAKFRVVLEREVNII